MRDTAAYAVHRRAYGAFSDYLQRLRGMPGWLREGANDVPAIDNWCGGDGSTLCSGPDLCNHRYCRDCTITILCSSPIILYNRISFGNHRYGCDRTTLCNPNVSLHFTHPLTWY